MDTTDVAPKDPRFALVIQYFKENESGSLADVLRYVKRKYRLGSREELTNVVESAVHSGAALGLFERKLAKAPSKPRIGTIRCSTHILPSQRCRCSSVKRRGLGNNKDRSGTSSNSSSTVSTVSTVSRLSSASTVCDETECDESDIDMEEIQNRESSESVSKPTFYCPCITELCQRLFQIKRH